MSNRVTIDVHQHLWPEPLLAALAARRRAPRLVRTPSGWELRLDTEPPSPLSLPDHDPARRGALVYADGLDRALVALSSPLGIEALPAGEAEPLLAAYHDGVRALGAPFGWWGAVGLETADPDAADALLDAGAVGISLPAGALASRRGLVRMAPLLERVAARRAPVFVHPGPVAAPAELAAPVWWPALTSYVTQMHTAWHAFLAWGRGEHDALDVVWAMLAGGAPLHVERLAARGGERGHDAASFYDVSSYGPRTVDAMVRAVGIEQLVLGSDRPVAAPPDLTALGDAFAAELREGGPAGLRADMVA